MSVCLSVGAAGAASVVLHRQGLPKGFQNGARIDSGNVLGLWGGPVIPKGTKMIAKLPQNDFKMTPKYYAYDIKHRVKATIEATKTITKTKKSFRQTSTNRSLR